ncbi:MAG: hypothetical protein KC619_24605 [Myxococcales bacterium]|nr:hypothetical protein [Myxococcales bacterium]
MGRKRKPGTPDATMQLDAVADDFEVIDAPSLDAMGPGAPPPLPPKKAGTSAWLVGGLVVVLAAAAAVGIGLVLRSMRTPAPTPAAAAEPPPAPQTPVAEAPEAPAEAPATVQMEAIVFDEGEVDEGAEPDPAEAPAAPE